MIDTSTSTCINQCFLCRRKSNRVVWVERGIEGHLCDCGTVYSDFGTGPIPKFDLATEIHPGDFYSGPSRFKAKWMAAHCPPGGRLLEVGCGEPSFLEAAREYGYEIAAMEPHPGRAATVERTLGIPVERAFIEDDTLPPGGFDVVYHCDLLVHFPDPLRALASMTRLLKPGGVLCFEVGTLGGISKFWYTLCRELDLGPHLFLYSRKALDMLWQQANLEVVHRKEFGLGPDVVLKAPCEVLARRVIRPLASERHASAFLRRSEAVLRYNVGSFTPGVGPSTFLFVMRPKTAGANAA